MEKPFRVRVVFAGYQREHHMLIVRLSDSDGLGFQYSEQDAFPYRKPVQNDTC